MDANHSQAIEEVKWTDDSIRWEGGLNAKTDDAEEEQDCLIDPFK